jgi:hypothetical protein
MRYGQRPYDAWCGDCGARLVEDIVDPTHPEIRGMVRCPNNHPTKVGPVDRDGTPIKI